MSKFRFLGRAYVNRVRERFPDVDGRVDIQGPFVRSVEPIITEPNHEHGPVVEQPIKIPPLEGVTWGGYERDYKIRRMMVRP